MKAASTALNNLLLTGSFVMADLYTITLNNGSVLRWTAADKSISYGGHTWTRGPLLDRGVISNKIGLETSAFDLTIGATSADTVGGVALIPFIRANGLDGATVLLERAYMATWSSAVTGTLIDFSGLVTSVKGIGPIEATVTVSSWMVRLNNNVPPDLYQPACLNTLFDSHCTLLAADFQTSGAVAGSGMTQLTFNTNLTQADGYFDQGKIVFTSGANNGLVRAVKSYLHASGAMRLSLALPVAPTAGDTFHAYPGCDLLKATCSGKFSNLIHFRGQPFVPVPETAVGA